MKNTIILLLLSFSGFAQTKTVITGSNLMVTEIPNYVGVQIVIGKIDSKVIATDFNLVNGTRLTLNWPADSSKAFKFMGDKTKSGTITITYSESGTPIGPAPITIQALNYTTMKGITRGSDYIGSTDATDYVVYKVQGGYKKITTSYSRGQTIPVNGVAEIRSGSTTGTILGTLLLPNTASPASASGWGIIKTASAAINATTGADIYIVFKGGDGTGDFRTFTFE